MTSGILAESLLATCVGINQQSKERNGLDYVGVYQWSEEGDGLDSVGLYQQSKERDGQNSVGVYQNGIWSLSLWDFSWNLSAAKEDTFSSTSEGKFILNALNQ